MLAILVQILKVLFVLVALIMTFFILLQEGKGGGLAGLGGTKAAGVEGVTNPIRRATAVLSIIFFLLAVLLGILARPTGSTAKAKLLYDTETPTSALASPDAEKKPVPPEAPQVKVPEEKKDAEPKSDASKEPEVKTEPAAGSDEKPAAPKDEPAPEKTEATPVKDETKTPDAAQPADEKKEPAPVKKAE